MNDLVIDQQAADVSHVEPDERQPVVNDLRHAMMTLPVGTQQAMLAEYKARRDNFRQWLMSQLIEGVHFGIVPGCEPKKKVENGVTSYGVWTKGKNGAEGKFIYYPESQWTPKPSLYAAGADFLCDILGVRDEYETDEVGWKQMGGKTGTCVVRCRLFSRASDKLIGESLGAYSHQYDANNALKMASKCAKVGAVINAYGLRDLFSQDEPPKGAPPSENPEADTAAPKAQPRGKRTPPQPAPQTAVSKQRLDHLWAHWLDKHKPADGNLQTAKDKFGPWVHHYAGRTFNHRDLPSWGVDDYTACLRALNIEDVQ